MKKYAQKIRTWLAQQIEPLGFRQRVFLAVVSLLLPTFLYLYFYFLPSYRRLQSMDRQIAQLQKEIQKYRVLASQKSYLEAKIRQRKIFFKRLVYILPNEREIPDLLSRVSERAKQSGLQVLSFTPKPEIRQNYYNVIPVTLELSGDFPELVYFWEDVEHLPRIITLASMNIQLKSGRNQQYNLFVHSTFNTYRYTGTPLKKTQKRARR
ncbi:type 4a pilus biogenesis protein PilO [Thermosulfurimonas sp.]|uniref:type 4a pilus biogenesis protein PilO n=1 Tax=Thermosulfurimonas sp. TaxID=2080236 RepID=UPI0025E3D191|nr:type 4a pilus biogenesis protein PilO [Thermosulfurimonas sp.]